MRPSQNLANNIPIAAEIPREEGRQGHDSQGENSNQLTFRDYIESARELRLSPSLTTILLVSTCVGLSLLASSVDAQLKNYTNSSETGQDAYNQRFPRLFKESYQTMGPSFLTPAIILIGMCKLMEFRRILNSRRDPESPDYVVGQLVMVQNAVIDDRQNIEAPLANPVPVPNVRLSSNNPVPEAPELPSYLLPPIRSNQSSWDIPPRTDVEVIIPPEPQSPSVNNRRT